MRVSFFLLLFLTMLVARENPFEPAMPHEKIVVDFQNISLAFDNSRIEIKTKDRLIKEQSLQDPPRSVLDFRFRANSRATQSVDLNIEPFKSVRIGYHKSFYRVVVEYDSDLKSKISDHLQGYEVKLHK